MESIVYELLTTMYLSFSREPAFITLDGKNHHKLVLISRLISTFSIRHILLLASIKKCNFWQQREVKFKTRFEDALLKPYSV